jgi:hypothetical protein
MTDNTDTDDDDDDDDEHSSSPSCPICLDSLDDATLLDPCFHRFCFACALAWLRVTPTCPLCKSPPVAVIHHIVSPHDFVRSPLAHALRAAEPASNVSSSKRRHVDISTRAASTTTVASTTVAPMAMRRAVYEQRRKVRPLQFAAAAEQRSSVADALERQRRLDDVAQNLSKQWSRIQPFAERDLRAITGASDVDLLLRAVKALVTAHNVRRTDDAQRYMQHFFTPQFAAIFFDELVAFAAASFNIPTYDRLVQYEKTEATTNVDSNHVRQSSSSSSSSSSSHDLAPASVTSTAQTSVSSQRSPFCTCDGTGACSVCHEVAFLRSKLATLDEEIADNAARLAELEQRRHERYENPQS